MQKPESLTPKDSGLRFANGVIDSKRNRIIVVQEDHSKDDLRPDNTIAAVGELNSKDRGPCHKNRTRLPLQ